jgi:hypothetical protein
MARIWHYDGASAVRQEPELVPEGDGFRLQLDGALGDHHRWTDLTFVNGTVYGHKERKGWRLIPANMARWSIRLAFGLRWLDLPPFPQPLSVLS